MVRPLRFHPAVAFPSQGKAGIRADILSAEAGARRVGEQAQVETPHPPRSQQALQIALKTASPRSVEQVLKVAMAIPVAAQFHHRAALVLAAGPRAQVVHKAEARKRAARPAS